MGEDGRQRKGDVEKTGEKERKEILEITETKGLQKPVNCEGII